MGLIKYNWDFIDNYSDEEISYFLHLEGKSIEAIGKIRNMDKSDIERHIINCKIKYRYIAKSDNMDELFHMLMSADKEERIYVINSLDRVNKAKFIHYIMDSFMNLTIKEKESALWIMGELRLKEAMPTIIKATVNNHVNIRRLSISAIGKIGIKSEAIERALLRGLKDSNPQVVVYAIKSLQRIHSIRALEEVKKVCNDWDKDYIKKACDEYIVSLQDKDKGE